MAVIFETPFDELVEKAKEKISSGDASGALSSLYGIFKPLYNAHVDVCRGRESKRKAASPECEHYAGWWMKYHKYGKDKSVERVLKMIEDYIIIEGRRFVTVEGDDIAKKVRAMKNHCEHFYKLGIENGMNEEIALEKVVALARRSESGLGGIAKRAGR